MHSPAKHRAAARPNAGRSVVRLLGFSALGAALAAGGIVCVTNDAVAGEMRSVAAYFVPDPGSEPTSAIAGAPAADAVAQQVLPGTVLEPGPRAEKLSLAAKAEKKAARPRRVGRFAKRTESLPFTLRIGTFNVLASQHTTPGGDHPKYPSAAWRTPQAAALIQRHGVGVVGLQEVKPDQLNGLLSATGFQAYPGYQFGAGDTDNSILYDPALYEFVEGTSFPVTFMSRPRPQTVLKLRDKATGREFYVVNMHVSAGHDRRNTATRIAGHNTAVAKANELMQTGLPLFMTGDMNDRAAFFCRVLPPTGMVAAVGGSTAGGCAPPARMPVDWVIGSPQVVFRDYWLDESATARKISDHFFVSATADVPAAPEPQP